MEREVKKLLFDILESTRNIDTFLGEKKYYEEYKNNTLVRRAIERELEIIGEAIHRLLKINPDIDIKKARKIVNFRNRISQINNLPCFFNIYIRIYFKQAMYCFPDNLQFSFNGAPD